MQREFNVLSDTERGYLAGFFDGEATFTVSRRRDGRNRRGVEYVPLVEIRHTNLAVLEHIKRIIGGGSVCSPPSCQKVGRRQIFVLSLYSPTLRAVLPQIKNLMVVRKRQAELVEEAACLKEKNMHLHESRRDQLETNFDRLEHIRLELKKLNHKRPFNTRFGGKA